MTRTRSAVIVEDDILICMMLEQFCADLDVRVVGLASRASQAIPMILQTRPTHLILDYRLVGPRTGLDIMREVRPRLEDVTIVFVTGSNEPETLSNIEAASPDAVLIKPIRKEDFRHALAA